MNKQTNTAHGTERKKWIKSKEKRERQRQQNIPRIGRIVHVIANRVHARIAGAAVLAARAARRALALLRRVVDVVARVVGRAGVVLFFS